ncbi:MAG: transposase [Muribaculaceae bacterium]|nr:transposase [Muribaculaceae bacterium]
MDRYPITGRSLEWFFDIDGDLFERQYKRHLSGYWQWKDTAEGLHAERWRVFPQNIGAQLSIDETSLSNGELYTIVTNKAAHGRKHSLVAIVAGTDSDTVLHALRQIPSGLRNSVEEITLDLSDSMRRICKYAFPHASRVIDRFHVQKLALEAVQEIRIKHRWEAIDADTEAREEAKLSGRVYVPERLENGDTLKELLARGRYALFKSPEKWTPQQHRRAEMLFELYPDLKAAYRLSQHLRAIFNKRSIKSAARLNLARWYNEVSEAGFRSFNTIAATVYEHHDEILNYFDNFSTNASAESVNSKIKAFRAKLHGVTDKKFFIFRICNIYA